MTYDSLSLSEVIPARPERIYAAWLSSAEHTAFTGDKAVVDPLIGGVYSTFDGYSSGRTVDLQPGRRIVQTWRAEDFPAGSPTRASRSRSKRPWAARCSRSCTPTSRAASARTAAMGG